MSDVTGAGPPPPVAPGDRGLIFDDPQQPDERRRRRRPRTDAAIIRVNRHRAVRLRPAWRRMAMALLLVVVALLLVVGVVAWYVAPDPSGWVGDVTGQWTRALRDWALGLLTIRGA